jgi:ubiquinone/menaquinone biosynthesis C-methylase UbiE
MKTRESGMPPEDLWQTFFNPAETLRTLGLNAPMADVADFGCGYGTFAIPAAQTVRGTVHAFDIEPDMIAATQAKARTLGLRNIHLIQRDFIAAGTGLPSTSVDYVMLFNILHAEDPACLLGEAFRILRPGGRLGVMHWNYDPATPRGPPLAIRPRPEQCARWTETAGFEILRRFVDLPPHHYGIVATKEKTR